MRERAGWYAQAWRLWPKAAWVGGNGPWATLAWCRVLTVELHETEEDARRALKMIDDTACGGLCRRKHELVRLNATQGA
jgi:hypothetical protein